MKINELKFITKKQGSDNQDTIYVAKTKLGKITVLDRLTGWCYGIRDIETGYKDNKKKFWLASGMFDIRDYGELTLEEAIEKIKENANVCMGV